MTIPGQDLKNICVLRTPEDANYIAANSEGKNVVIIGSSFIGKFAILDSSCCFLRLVNCFVQYLVLKCSFSLMQLSTVSSF